MPDGTGPLTVSLILRPTCCNVALRSPRIPLQGYGVPGKLSLWQTLLSRPAIESHWWAGCHVRVGHIPDAWMILSFIRG